MCNEFLGTENILPDGLLKARLDFIKQDSHLKQHFQPGRKIQLAVIPFSGNGIRLDPDGIKDGDYLRTLVVMEEKDEFGNVLSSKTVGGFSFYRNEVHKLLPAEFTECSFVVPSYSSNGPYTVTDAEREIIMTEYERALRKLQELLKGFVP